MAFRYLWSEDKDTRQKTWKCRKRRKHIDLKNNVVNLQLLPHEKRKETLYGAPNILHSNWYPSAFTTHSYQSNESVSHICLKIKILSIKNLLASNIPSDCNYLFHAANNIMLPISITKQSVLLSNQRSPFTSCRSLECFWVWSGGFLIYLYSKICWCEESWHCWNTFWVIHNLWVYQFNFICA